MVPPWDFNATSPSLFLDTSSALVAASGLVELATYVSSTSTRTSYLEAAKRIVQSVISTYVYSPAESDAVVKNGTSYFPNTGIPLIYGVHGVGGGLISIGIPIFFVSATGDYYLLDALQKLDIVANTPNGSQAVFLW